MNNADENTNAVIYPNPNDGSIMYVRVDDAENAKLSLINSLGNEVSIIKGIISEYVMTIKPSQNIDAGLYFINIVENNQRTIQKVMVVK
jgi:hypothetical protein